MTEKNKRWNDGIVNSLNIWKDTIDGEISRVVMEMRRNVKWREVAEQEGLGSLWVGGDSLPRATAGLSSKSDSTFETHNGLLSRGLAGIEKENQQAIFDLRTFGKAGVKLGLTAFTLGEEEFGEEESERLEGTDAGLLFGFLSLKKKVKAASRPNLLGTCEILRPFLAIVKSGNTTGLIIKIALESIEHLIKLEVIDFESAEGLKALHELSMTVTQCRFEATDLVADEVVLLQILEVLKLIVRSKNGEFLTDTAICGMIETVLGITCQMRLSEILRKSSEMTLLSLVEAIFKRFNELETEGKINAKPVELEPKEEGVLGWQPYGYGSAHELLKVLVTLTNIQNLQYTDTMRVLALKCLRTIVQVSGITISHHPELQSLVLHDLCYNLLVITAGSNLGLMFPAFRLLHEIILTQGERSKTQLELFLCQIVGRVMTPLADEREGEVGGDGSPKQQKQDGMDGDENKGMEKKAEGTDARNKNIDVNGGGKESGFSEHGESEGNFVSSIEVSRNSDAPKNAHEVELYNQMCMRPGVRGPMAIGEVRRVLLEELHRILTLTGTIMNCLWANYDCDMQRSNIYDFVISFVTLKAVPWPGTRHEIESPAYLDILLHYIHNMASRAGVEQPVGSWAKLLGKDEDVAVGTGGVGVGVGEGTEDEQEGGVSIKNLLQRRRRKVAMYRAALQFNEKPSKGIAYLQNAGYLPSDSNTEMIMKLARFLRTTPALNKKLVGEYLSKPSSSEVLHAYLGQFDFKHKRLDEAARMLLGTFRLPGESQQIEKIMGAFSTAYFASEPEEIASRDAAFVLSFAIIMLNTDQHNPRVKSRMKFEDFCKNLRGVNDGQDFSTKLLRDIYDEIRKKEIVFPEEHEGEAGFEHAWKEMVGKDEITDEGEGETNGMWLESKALDRCDRILFSAIWSRLLQVIVRVVVHCSNDYALRAALSGLYSVLGIAAKYNIVACVDEALIYLAQLSGTLNSQVLEDVESPQIVECRFTQITQYQFEEFEYDSDNSRMHVQLQTDSQPQAEPENKARVGVLAEINEGMLIKAQNVFAERMLEGLNSLLIENCVKLGDSSMEECTPQRLARFMESDNVMQWEFDGDRGLVLTNLALQLGRDYCGQIALFCLFQTVQQWPEVIGVNGWRVVLAVLQNLVNSDLVSQKSLRVRHLVHGVSTIPRVDTLKRYNMAKRKVYKEALGDSKNTETEKAQSGGKGLFSALTSFLGGVTMSPDSDGTGYRRDANNPELLSELGYLDWSTTIPGVRRSSKGMRLTRILGVDYISSLDGEKSEKSAKESSGSSVGDKPGDSGVAEGTRESVISTIKEVGDNPQLTGIVEEQGARKKPEEKYDGYKDISARFMELKPFRLRTVSKWREPLDLLVQLVLSSKDCVLSCELDQMFSGVSEIPDKSFQRFLTGLSTFFSAMESGRLGETRASKKIGEKLGGKGSKDLQGGNDSHSISSSSTHTATSGMAQGDQQVSGGQDGRVVGAVGSQGRVGVEGFGGDGRNKYRRSELFFVEVVGYLCESMPEKIPQIWNVFESQFRRAFENADRMDLLLVERMTNVLLRIAIVSLMAIAENNESCKDNARRIQKAIVTRHQDVVERIFRCVALLSDCKSDTLESAEEAVAAGLRVIAMLDYRILVAANNWPVVSLLLRSLSRPTESQPQYPSKAMQAGFEVVVYLSHKHRLDTAHPEDSLFKPPTSVFVTDILDLLLAFNPPDRMYSVVSGGGAHKAQQLKVSSAKQKGALALSQRILSELVSLQTFANQQLIRHAYNPASTQNQPNSYVFRLDNTASQLFNQWLKTLNSITALVSSKNRDLGSASCLNLQRSLMRTQWLAVSAPVSAQQKSDHSDKDTKSSAHKQGSQQVIPTPPSSWVYSILQRVLLPLMYTLLRPDTMADSKMEDIHIKALNLLSYFVLNHSNELINCDTTSSLINTPGSTSISSSSHTFGSNAPIYDFVLPSAAINVPESHHHQSSQSQSAFDLVWLRIVDVFVKYMATKNPVSQFHQPRTSATMPLSSPDQSVLSGKGPNVSENSAGGTTVPTTPPASAAKTKTNANQMSLANPAMGSVTSKQNQGFRSNFGLAEIAQEQLKNLILVIDSFGVFNNTTTTDSNPLENVKVLAPPPPSPSSQAATTAAAVDNVDDATHVEGSSNARENDAVGANVTDGEAVSPKELSDANVGIDANKNHLWVSTWASIDNVNGDLKALWFSY